MSASIGLERILKVRSRSRRWRCRRCWNWRWTSRRFLRPSGGRGRADARSRRTRRQLRRRQASIPNFTAPSAARRQRGAARHVGTLSRQLTIIFGLSTLQKELKLIVAEHDELLNALQQGNAARLQAQLMKVHILDYSRALDYEGYRRRQRSAKPDGPPDAPPGLTRGGLTDRSAPDTSTLPMAETAPDPFWRSRTCGSRSPGLAGGGRGKLHAARRRGSGLVGESGSGKSVSMALMRLLPKNATIRRTVLMLHG
jgi:hypothetical protein